MGKIAELSNMRFGIEIEPAGISRKNTVLAIMKVVGGSIQQTVPDNAPLAIIWLSGLLAPCVQSPRPIRR